MIQRRGFLAGAAALLAAPAIIRTPGLLMPVKAAPTLDPALVRMMKFALEDRMLSHMLYADQETTPMWFSGYELHGISSTDAIAINHASLIMWRTVS